MGFRLLLLCFFSQSAFAEIIISEIENRKTGEKIVIHKITENALEVSLSSSLGNKLLTTLQVQKAMDKEYELKTPSGRPLYVYRTLTKRSADIGKAIGKASSKFAKWCVEDPAHFFLVCYFPIPGALVYYPAVAGSLTVALSSTFVLAHIILPFEGIYEGIKSVVPDRERRKVKAWNRALHGKSSKVSDKVFRKLVKAVSELK